MTTRLGGTGRPGRWWWWRSGLAPGGAARGDAVGGFTAAIVMLAIEGSYGVIAFAPLGPQGLQLGFLWGVYAGVIANLATAAAGGRGPMMSGSSAAMALLVPPLLLSLLADPRFLLPGDRPNLPLLLAFLAFGTLLAGVLQAAIGALKLGSIGKFVPYPVHAGFMNGVAVLMVIAMLPHLLGLAPVAGPLPWRDARPLAVLVALTALAIALRPPRFTRPVPAYLTALVGATALHHLLAASVGADALGPLLATLQFEWPGPDVLAPLSQAVQTGLLAAHLPSLLQFALTVVLLSSLQSLLSSSVIDGMTGRRRDGDRVVLAQGVGNIACGLLGAVPSAGAVSRSVIGLQAGATTAAACCLFSVCLLAAFAAGAAVLRHVPMAAIAGVFVAGAFVLVDRWTRRATVVVARQLSRGRAPPRTLAQNYAVTLLVAGTSVFASLPLGVAVGTLAAMLMFIRSNSLRPVRSVARGDRRRSLKVRPAWAAEMLKVHGRRIGLIELDGALFFGTADAAAREIERLAEEADQLVIDFRRVGDVDASGARVLLNAAAAVKRSGRRLLLASLARHDARGRAIADMDVDGVLADGDFHADVDVALEDAEDHLLAGLGPILPARARLPLGQTMLGHGLSASELELLSAMLVEVPVERGGWVFRRGDPGDALYVSVLGEIGIWLSDARDGGRGHRIVSFAPGVVFGEMALLQRVPRSASAMAEDDAVLLELSRGDFERLAEQHPALLGKVLLNLSLHLSSRVRALSDEIEAANR